MSYNLPESWELTKLKWICNIQGGFAFKSKDYKKKGIPLLRISNVSDEKVSFEKNTVYLADSFLEEYKDFLLYKGDIVIALSGATTGKYGKFTSDEKALLNQRVGRIRYKNDDSINHDYIYYFLGIIRNLILKEAYGAAQPNISTKELADFDIPFPPYAEQNRIVSKIEELFTRLDAGVESLKQVQALLKKYRQSLLKSAVEGRLTSEWRKQHKDELEPADKLLDRILKERKNKWEAEQLANFKAKGKTPPKNWQNRYKEPTLPDTSVLPELPKGWVWVGLETISNALGGYAFKSKDYSERGYQIIKIGNVKMNSLQIDKSPCFIEKLTPEIIDKYLLKKKDILITLTGTRKKRDYGFVAMVRDEIKLLLNQRVARLKFTNKVRAEYYLIALQSEEFRDRLFSGETGNVGQGNIGMGSITKEAIPLPPIKEQDYIVSECQRLFSIIDESEKIIEAEFKRSKSLRQSILKRAFEGELVPQDPNDEPASVLLEKIKAEKSNHTKLKQLEMF